LSLKIQSKLRKGITWLLLLCCLTGSIPAAFAQYESEKDASIPLDNFYIKRKGSSGLRNLLSKIYFGFSTGYGQTFFKHDLTGYGIFQNPGAAPTLFTPGQVATGYSNWFNRATPTTNTVTPGTFLVSSDTTSIGFKSSAWSIPFKLTAHVEFDRYRLGGGYSIEYMHIGDFKSTSYSDDVNDFSPEDPSIFLKKYFVYLGGAVYRYNSYLLVVDANIGGYNLGKSFDKSVIKKGVYINIGATVEREMSEYFKLFVRPSYELKSYKLNVPESSSITHKFNAFYINIGATYRLPELRRCPFKTCHGQINHAHGNREYRSRMHPIYKKQNPHYGENYPTLLKYKGKNKKKLNPY